MCVSGAKFKAFLNNLTRLFPHLWLLEVPQLLCNVVSLDVVRMMKLLLNAMDLVFCIRSPLKIIRERCLQVSHILSAHTCWFSVQLIRIPLAEESKSYGHHFHVISWLPPEPSPYDCVHELQRYWYKLCQFGLNNSHTLLNQGCFPLRKTHLFCFRFSKKWAIWSKI